MKFLTTEKEFNDSKTSDWDANCDFWANEFKRNEHSDNNTKKAMSVIRAEAAKHKNPTIIDVGCGHAWVADALKNTDGLKFKYWGLDYMPGFIDANIKKYAGDKNVRFNCCDVATAKVPSLDTFGRADIVVNYFNLIEIWNMDQVFFNMSKMLKPDGLLVVATSDAVSRIAALSESKEDFVQNFHQYARVKSSKPIETFNSHTGVTSVIRFEDTIGYKFEIPGIKSARYLHAVAHSVADYVNGAAGYGLYPERIDELFNNESPDTPYSNLYALYPALVMQFRKLKAKHK
ncbi:MAG: class I SAM-dependent methyltransferase [Proteobacteria bacterium]|nr:class I SAM-dependent methyltransferase [Pseudomonadota bacterium]